MLLCMATPDESGAPRPSRRRVLRGAVWGAVGVVAGLAGGTAIGLGVKTGAEDSPVRAGGPGFDHLVVLAFENRSFDNLFGYLYSSHGYPLPSGQKFDGLQSGTRATMTGFIRDYINTHAAKTGVTLTESEYSVIMGSFTPAMLPVFSTLARNFAIYDHWHAPVPSQTFANRSFMNASTSNGFVVNKGAQGFKKWIDPALNSAPTIFNRLDDAGLGWAVYFDESQLISFTGLIHAPQLEPFWKTHFRTMTQFHDDVAEGNLPAYCIIEPRMIYNHNDMHPGTGTITEQAVDGRTVTGSGISDVRAGEVLLHEVYTSIKKSSSAEGSNALNTMLVVTFDETGGTYDHVPPPAATPPGDGKPGEQGFAFDRLGVRVPTLVISAYTAKGAVINDEMHHGSIISTICKQYGLPHLTDRDRHATTLQNAASLPSPRQPSTWPTTAAHYVPPNPETLGLAQGTNANHPLSPPAAGLLGVLLAKYGQPGDAIPKTYGGAAELLEKHGRELFGAK